MVDKKDKLIYDNVYYIVDGCVDGLPGYVDADFVVL